MPPPEEPVPPPEEPPKPPGTPTTVTQPIKDILDEYYDYYDPDRADTLSPSDVNALPGADFEKQAIASGEKPSNVGTWGGFYDENTGNVYVRTGSEDRGLTASHEFLHKVSNRGGFSPQETDSAGNVATVEKLGSGLEEAFTEHFNNKIAARHNQPVGDSAYNTDGRVKVAEAIEAAVGRDTLGKAYFGKGAGPVNDLITAVDEKFGPGTWDKVRDLCNKKDAAGKPAPDFVGARTLLNPPAQAAPAAPAAGP